MNKQLICLLLTALLAAALAPRAAAVGGPDREQVDLAAVKEASLEPFCEFMKRQNPHIRDWKKGDLPTDKELAALIKRSPSVAKDLDRIRTEFFQEIENDPAQRKRFEKKDKKPKREKKEQKD